MIVAKRKGVNILAVRHSSREGDLEKTERLLRKGRVRQSEAETVQELALDAFHKEHFSCGLVVCRSLQHLQCNDRTWMKVMNLLVGSPDREAALEFIGYLPDSSLAAIVRESSVLLRMYSNYGYWVVVIQCILSRLPQLPLIDCGFKTTVVHDPGWMKQRWAAEALYALLQHTSPSVLASRGSSWRTPLVAAMKGGVSEELVLMLLKATPPEGFLATDNSGNIPLVHAATWASALVFKKVAKATPREGFTHTNGNGGSWLTAAIRLGVSLKRLKYLYKCSGQDVSVFTRGDAGRGHWPFAAALLIHKNTGVLQWILDEMPKEALLSPIPLQTLETTNILSYAMQRSRGLDRVPMVLDAVLSRCGEGGLRDMLSLKPCSSAQRSPLEETLFLNNPQCVGWLLSYMEKYCPDELTLQDDNGATYLHKAVITKSATCVELLLPFYASREDRSARAHGLGGVTAAELAQRLLGKAAHYQRKDLEKIATMLQPAVKKAL